MSQRFPFVLSLAIVALLAGCSPVTPEPAPSASSTAGETVVETAAAAPSPLVEATCDELAPLEVVQAALAPDVVPREQPPRAYSPAFPLFQVAVAQLGGRECLWANGDPEDYAEDSRFVRLSVLPGASSAWAASRALLNGINDDGAIGGGAAVAFGDESSTDCASEDHGYYGTCTFDVLVGEYWLAFEITGVPIEGTGNRADVLVSHVAASVAALAAPAASWPLPAGAYLAPDTCDGLIPLADVRTQVGVSELVEDFGQQWSAGVLSDAAFAQAEGLHCNWNTPADWVDPTPAGRYVAYVELTILPGSAWYLDGLTEPPHQTSVALAPVAGVGDAAWGGCNSTYAECSLHVLVDNSWLVFASSNGGLPAVTALAQALLS